MPVSGHIGCRGTESGVIQGLEAKGKMRSFLVAFTALTLLASSAAQTKVSITVDKDNQQMTVAVDGVERYRWPVSTACPPTRRRTAASAPSGWKKTTTPRNSTTRRCRTRSSSPRSATPSRHRFRQPSRQPGLPWLRAAVARQRRDALRPGQAARRAQHHGDADRLLPGRAGAQSAAARNTAVARRAPQPQYEQQYDCAGASVVITPQSSA